jgi:hypothetical protein
LIAEPCCPPPPPSGERFEPPRRRKKNRRANTSTTNEKTEQVRRQAEAALKPALAKPEAVPELAARLQSAADAQVRQLSAVLLRKALPRHWRTLAPALRSGVQQLLLERLAAEPEHFVRRAVADAVAAVARLALPGWQKPLMGFLQQCAASPSPEHREVAMLLFASLCEAAPEHLLPHAASVQTAVATGLADTGASGAPPNVGTNARAGAAVRAAALAAVEPVLGLVDGKRAAEGFRRTVLPALLQLLRAQVQRQDDESELARALQALVEVVEAAEHRPGVLPVAGGALQAALEVAMAAASERSLDPDLREQALMVVHAAARARPRALGRQLPLAHALVTALCAVAAEPLPDDYEDDGAGEMPPCRAAAQALDVLALELPTEAVFPPAWAFVVRAAGAGAGGNAAAAAEAAAARAGAMNVLAVLCEGCADELRPRLAEALPLLLTCLGDAASADVRGAAAFALGQAAEHLQPEISSGECHALVLPRVFELLALDATPQVRERACYALNALCERLEADEIAPYVPSLVQQLVAVLRQSQGQPAVQEMALTALSTTAGSAGAAFAPHVQVVLPVLDHFMSGAGPLAATTKGGAVSARDAVGPRCRATECAGIVVEAVCGAGGGGDGDGATARGAPARDAPMMAALPRLMEAALRGFEVASQLDAKARALQQQQLRAFEAAMARPENEQDDDDDEEADGEDEADGASELREFAHGFFERVAATLGADFAPWIPRVAPLALASVKRDDGAGAGAAVAGGGGNAAAAAAARAAAAAAAGGGNSADPTPSGSQSVRGEEDDEDADDEDDDDDAAARRAMGVRTGLLDEMVAATGALAALAEAAPRAFAPPFAEAALAALKDVMYHTHEELRAAAAPAIKSVVVAVHVASGGRRADEQGAEAAAATATAAPVPPASVAVAAAALPLLLAPIEEEPDVDATAAATSALAGILRALPAAAVGPANLEAASKAAAALLTGDALCQNELADSDEEEEDGAEEDGGGAGADARATVTAAHGGGGHKAVGAAAAEAADDEDEDGGGGGRGLADGEEDALVSAAGEVLTALAGALGTEAFARVFQAGHLDPLLSRLAADQPSGVRAAAAGVVSELAQLLGGGSGGGGAAAAGSAAAAASSALAHRALPLVLEDLRPDGAAAAAASSSDPPDATNRQNAAFAVGALAEACPAAAAAHVGRVLQALHPHFAPLAGLAPGSAPASVEEPSVLDNAAGAVGRLVAALGSEMPQLEQVLPLLARALPLREDLGETLPAVRALAMCLTTPALAVRASGAAADGVRALAGVAAQRAAPDEARVVAARALAQLHEQHPGQVGPMLAALPQEHQQAVREMAAGGGTA